jgi:hypothetical protein
MDAMMIKRLPGKYETSDRETFDTKQEAKIHENEIQTHAALGRILAPGLGNGHINNVIQNIMTEGPMVIALLKNYLRHAPQEDVFPIEDRLAKAA